MMESKWLYLALNLFTIFIPLIRSFEPRINYYGKWKALFSSIGLVGVFFIVWDAIFTAQGVWGFNPRYLSGVEFFYLPLGEWLFFVTVPYACVFIFEVLNYFWPKSEIWDKIAKPLTVVIASGALVLAITFQDQAYTFWNFSFIFIFLLLILLVIKPVWLGKFYRAYLVGLLGFFFVNGILTGTGIEEQVVWYNPEEFMGLRMGTIPVEDTFYGMLLIMMNVWLYEWLKKRFSLS